MEQELMHVFMAIPKATDRYGLLRFVSKEDENKDESMRFVSLLVLDGSPAIVASNVFRGMRPVSNLVSRLREAAEGKFQQSPYYRSYPQDPEIMRWLTNISPDPVPIDELRTKRGIDRYIGDGFSLLMHCSSWTRYNLLGFLIGRDPLANLDLNRTPAHAGAELTFTLTPMQKQTALSNLGKLGKYLNGGVFNSPNELQRTTLNYYDLFRELPGSKGLGGDQARYDYLRTTFPLHQNRLHYIDLGGSSFEAALGAAPEILNWFQNK